MNITAKRVEVICRQLREASQGTPRPLTQWLKKDGLFFRPEEAEAAAAPWEEFDSETRHWYGPDKHYWFRTSFTMPQELAGKPVRLGSPPSWKAGTTDATPNFCSL